MKKFKKYVILAFLAITAVSCDSYLDVNENTYQIPEEEMRPDHILPGALTRSYRVQARDMTILGNYFMNNWYGDVNNWGGVAQNAEYTLNVTSTFYNGIWDGTYLGLANYQAIINYDSENYDNFKAVAYIMKSFYMQYIVDLYGDAPYFDAFQGFENLNPAYTDDELIYEDLLLNLDRAVELFNNADADDIELGDSDVVFAGDVNQWLAFANTVKIKLLLRQDDVIDPVVRAERFNEIALSGLAPIAADINPGYTSSAEAQMNPYYDYFYTTSAAETMRTYLRASGYIADFLNGAVNGVVDNRREALYELIAGDVRSVDQGVSPAAGLTPPLSKIELPFASATVSGNIVSQAEVHFLLAEAAEKGYLTAFGGAQANFDAGISASFSRYGASMGTYMSDISSVPGLGWSGDHMEAIMTQKWLATNSINPIEAYIDMTRTGFPAIPLATTAQYSHKPYRLPYPISEITGNSANMPVVPQADLFSASSQYVPFWKN